MELDSVSTTSLTTWKTGSARTLRSATSALPTPREGAPRWSDAVCGEPGRPRGGDREARRPVPDEIRTASPGCSRATSSPCGAATTRRTCSSTAGTAPKHADLHSEPGRRGGLHGRRRAADVHQAPAPHSAPVGNGEWELASPAIPEAHPDEYVSVHSFRTGDATKVRPRRVRRPGALHPTDHLREPGGPARGEPALWQATAGRPDPAEPGPRGPAARAGQHLRGRRRAQPRRHRRGGAYKRPWTYLGPGMHQAADGRIHIGSPLPPTPHPASRTTTARPTPARCGWRSRRTPRRRCACPTAGSCTWKA